MGSHARLAAEIPDIFRHGRGQGAVAVCFEGCCGSMCWPVDRPATHARRGSGSTRGFNFFVLGDSFTRSGVDGTRGLGVGGLIRCAGRPREWSCGAVPPQERWHEGGWFLFFLWRLLRCRACVDHRSGCERIPPELRQRHPSRAVASRQRAEEIGDELEGESKD